MTIQAVIVACRQREELLMRPVGWEKSGTALKIKPGEETLLKVTPLRSEVYEGLTWQPTLGDLLSRWELVTMETLLAEVEKDDSGKRYQDAL